MERLLPVWQVLGRDGTCFPRKEMCENSLSSRIQTVSVGVSTEPCYARWEVETDEVILQRWQKQIDYGKCTPGYQCFLHQVLNLQTWWLLPPPLPGSVRKNPATGSTFQLITAIYLSQS
ncbi:oocyte-specific histone RNA stem-loop-binding protein 2-like [Pongo pygmaeus]|uniref:oocyte-specific histone RNA stem-loop-binding protein 2-like n=1 Tax=Pongo pygmaeus TaxID=9600 RepID=UPI00300C6A4B